MGVDAAHMSFEPRSATMGTFVCIPRDSSSEVRNAFDPDKRRRRAAIQAIREQLPALPDDKEYEILPAGSTSIDVGLHDKKAGMEHIIQSLKSQNQYGNTVFFGDGFDGGNDTPVAAVMGIAVVHVRDTENTAAILGGLKECHSRAPLHARIDRRYRPRRIKFGRRPHQK